MHLNEILAVNLRALMDNRDDLNTQQRIRDKAARLGYRLSQSSVQRILAREVHTSLDIVEQLSEAYGVSPLSLLSLAKTETGETVIPPSYDEQRLLIAWRKLSDEDKHRVAAFISVASVARNTKKTTANDINLDKKQGIPAHMEAATRRASGKMIQPVTTVSVTTNHVETQGNQESEDRTPARKPTPKRATR